MKDSNTIDKPLVTCIVTSYQKIPYLYEALDSVLNQNYPNLEIIVADDGSDRFPNEELDKYIGDRKRGNVKKYIIIHQEKNIGTVGNIRNALTYASGEYCVNLDGDDVFDHDSVLFEMVEYMSANHLDLLECGKRWCDENLNEKELLPTPKEKLEIAKLNTAKKQYHSFAVLRFLNIGGGTGMAYLKDSVEKNGLFDPTYRNWQDGPSLIEYVRRGKTIPTNHNIIAVKYRAGGVSNSPEQNNESKIHIGEDHMRFIENVTIPDHCNPYLFRRRRFMYYYYMDKAKSKLERVLVLIRFPIMGCRMLLGAAKKRKRKNSNF